MKHLYYVVRIGEESPFVICYRLDIRRETRKCFYLQEPPLLLKKPMEPYFLKDDQLLKGEDWPRHFFLSAEEAWRKQYEALAKSPPPTPWWNAYYAGLDEAVRMGLAEAKNGDNSGKPYGIFPEYAWDFGLPDAA